MKKTKVKLSKISKTSMYEVWYDYIKPKYQTMQNYVIWIQIVLLFILKLRIFIKILLIMLKNGLTHQTIGEMIRPLPRGMNKKVIGLMKDELGGKITIEFVAFRPKTYSYLMDDYSSKKKAKGTKKCVIKRMLKFNFHKDCLLNNKIMLKLQQRFKSKAHCVYTEEINMTALSSNNDKRLQTFDRITIYPYGSNAFKVWESEMLSKYK